MRTTQTGPVAELGLVAAGLGLVIYLIAFVADLGGSTSLVLPLLLGGGLLAGTVALPSVGTRVLAPAAVVTTTGALLLLRAVVDDGSALSVGALVLGLLEAGATVGATLMQAGVVRSRPSKEPQGTRVRRRSPGIPRARSSPGSSTRASPTRARTPPLPRRAPFPGDQWTGEHAYGQNARYGGAVRRARLPAATAVGDPRLRPAAARLGGPDRGRRGRGARS